MPSGPTRREATKRKADLTPEDAVSAHETKARIVTAATRLFASQGYEETPIREIARAAQANTAMINYYFRSKEKLYSHIIGRFEFSGLESVRKTLRPPTTRDEMNQFLEIFLEETAESILENQDLFLMVLRELETGRGRSDAVFQNTLLKHYESLATFFGQAKANGLLNIDVEPDFAAQSLLSQLIARARGDHLTRRFLGHSFLSASYRRGWIQQTLRIFLGGISIRGG